MFEEILNLNYANCIGKKPMSLGQCKT